MFFLVEPPPRNGRQVHQAEKSTRPVNFIRNYESRPTILIISSSYHAYAHALAGTREPRERLARRDRHVEEEKAHI